MAAQGVYNGLANVGQLKAQIGLGVSICLALSLCTSGGFALRSFFTDKHTSTVQGSVTPTPCPASTSCPAPIKYTVDGKTYTLNGSFMSPLPATMNVSYDPKNPSDSEQGGRSLALSAFLMGAAVVILIIGYFVYRVTMAYKPVAAIEGAGALYNLGKAVI